MDRPSPSQPSAEIARERGVDPVAERDTASTIERLFQLVRSQTGMPISLSDFTGVFDTFDELRASPWLREHSSPVCARAKSTQVGLEHCVAQKGRVVTIFHRRRRPMCGTCPWGLTEIVEPIYLQHLVVGAVFYGPFVIREDEADARRRLASTCRQLALQSNPYTRAFKQVVRVDRSDLPRHCRDARRLRQLVEDLIRTWNVPIPSLIQRTAHGEPVAMQYPDLVLRAMRIIHADPTAPLTVGRLADRLGCHPNHLSQTFTRSTGKRLTRYLQEQRIDRAKAMLLSGRYPIWEIAGLCGFKEVTHFSRAFRRLIGIPPGQYRKTTEPRHT